MSVIDDIRRANREDLRRKRIGQARTSVWFGDRWERAQEMRAKGYQHSKIAEALGLTEKQVHDKFANESYGQRAKLSHEEEHRRLDERDALFASPRTLTELLCGDPLPGRSALDKKRSAPAP